MIQKVHCVWLHNERPENPIEKTARINKLLKQHSDSVARAFRTDIYSSVIDVWTNLRAAMFISANYPKLWPLYDKLTQPVAKSDILRLCVVNTHGGWYTDYDIEFFKSPEPLVDRWIADPVKVLCFKEQTNEFVTNSIFYAEPNTRTITRMIEALEKKTKLPDDNWDILQFAGPGFFTEHCTSAGDVKILPAYHFEYAAKQERPFQYGFHHNAKTWLDD